MSQQPLPDWIFENREELARNPITYMRLLFQWIFNFLHISPEDATAADFDSKILNAQTLHQFRKILITLLTFALTKKLITDIEMQKIVRHQRRVSTRVGLLGSVMSLYTLLHRRNLQVSTVEDVHQGGHDAMGPEETLRKKMPNTNFRIPNQEVQELFSSIKTANPHLYKLIVLIPSELSTRQNRVRRSLPKIKKELDVYTSAEHLRTVRFQNFLFLKVSDNC